MFIKIWSLTTLVLAGLLMGTSLGHALQMPAKMRYAVHEWMHAQHTLYLEFGRIGGPIEILAIVGAASLAIFLRDWRPSMIAAFIGATCLTVAFVGIWLPVTNRINANVATWSGHSWPADWEQWRTKWELSHLARFLLQLAGFSMLAVATLISPLAED